MGPNQPLNIDYCFFSEIKRQGCEIDYSLPSCVDVKNAWNNISPSLICRCGADWLNLPFTALFLVLGCALSRPLSSTTILFHLTLSSFHTFVYELCKFDIINSVHYSYYHSAKNVYWLMNVIDYMNYGVENALDKLI
jgi:hypothetical protein